ncbi:MAG: hypothetical protein QOI01_2937 [Mycobacterium sp.]|nr:hypothetical protein [Mycobacterium sp.]
MYTAPLALTAASPPSIDSYEFLRPDWTAKGTVSRPAPQWAAITWGPYFDAMFPSQEVSTWISWKMTSTRTNIARRLWDQREELRAEYEDVAFGSGSRSATMRWYGR